MIVIDRIHGDADFEYHGHELSIYFKALNPHTDELVDICISQWASVSLQEAVIHALEIIASSSVSKSQLVQGRLHQADL